MAKKKNLNGKFCSKTTGKKAFDCTLCPGYCCSIYDLVEVSDNNLDRLARHFGMPPAQCRDRFTKIVKMSASKRGLRHKKDTVFPRTCVFLDRKSRRCTVYEARPKECRKYPGDDGCRYFELLQHERDLQEDKTIVPVVKFHYCQGPWVR